jgi:hypothetical protein
MNMELWRYFATIIDKRLDSFIRLPFYLNLDMDFSVDMWSIKFSYEGVCISQVFMHSYAITDTSEEVRLKLPDQIADFFIQELKNRIIGKRPSEESYHISDGKIELLGISDE